MANLNNTTLRLIWGPLVKGFARGRFVPGANVLKDDYWRAIKDRKAIDVMLKDGRLKIEDADEGAEEVAPDAAPSPLAELNARDAKVFIEAVNDPDDLDAWRKTEHRSSVIKAIENRIDELIEAPAE